MREVSDIKHQGQRYGEEERTKYWVVLRNEIKKRKNELKVAHE